VAAQVHVNAILLLPYLGVAGIQIDIELSSHSSENSGKPHASRKVNQDINLSSKLLNFAERTAHVPRAVPL
jgi:hypothetical protein